MALPSSRQNTQVNPDKGIYVEMEDIMEVRYTSEDPDYYQPPEDISSPPPTPVPGSKMDQTVSDLKQMFPDVPSSKMINLCNVYNCNIPFIVEQLLSNPDKYTDDVENMDANKSSASTSALWDSQRAGN